MCAAVQKNKAYRTKSPPIGVPVKTQRQLDESIAPGRLEMKWGAAGEPVQDAGDARFLRTRVSYCVGSKTIGSKKRTGRLGQTRKGCCGEVLDSPRKN